jgi:hypothetical protein
MRMPAASGTSESDGCGTRTIRNGLVGRNCLNVSATMNLLRDGIPVLPFARKPVNLCCAASKQTSYFHPNTFEL